MNTTQAQQKAFDDALVSPADHLEFGKFTIHKSSIRFTIKKKKVSLDVETFRDILQIWPKIPGERFEEPPLEHDILSFLRDLGHTRDIHYVTDKKTSPTAKGSRLNSLAKVAKSNKKKQPALMPKTKGLLYYLRAGVKLEVPDVPKDDLESEGESWTFSQDDDDEELDMNDDSEETESDNDGDDFTHLNLLTYKANDQEEEEEKQMTKKCFLIREDLNLNLERSDTEMTDAQANQETNNAHVTLTAKPPMKEAVVVVVQLQSNKLREEEDEMIKTWMKTPLLDQTKGRRQGDQAKKLSHQKNQHIKNPSSLKGTSRSQPKSAGKSAHVEEHGQKVDDLEDQPHQEFNTGNDDASLVRGAQNDDEHIIPPQLWITQMAQAVDTQSLFNEFLATPIDFSTFIINRLKIDILTQKVLTGPTYDLIKDTCKSVVELEYQLEEVFKATNDRLDWHNPEGTPYPYDLSKPLPLIQNERGHQVIPFDHFINNDLEYIKGGSSSQRYTTSITKAKAVDYDIIPPQLWITQMAQAVDTQSLFNEFLATPIDFSTFIINRLKIDILTQKVLTGPTYDLIKDTCKSVVELEYQLEEVFKATNDRLDWHNPEGTPYPYDLSKPLPLIQNERGHQVIPFDHFINNDLEYIKGGSSSQRYTTSITKAKAVDYGRVKWIEGKKFYVYASSMETTKDVYSRRIVIQERVEDLQLGVKSYQNKINLKRPDKYFPDLKKMTAYIAYPDIQGIIYEDEINRKCLMRTDELHKFSDDTLNHVRTALNDIALGIKMDYFPKRKLSNQDKQSARVMINAIDKKLRDRRLMRNMENFVGGRPYEGDLRLLERTI
nr:hypothetical protein [Tanacetum cinerariifolium]